MADSKKEFGSAEKVWAITEQMQVVEDARALDRAKIDILFNGSRPYSPKEVEKHGIEINVNWGMGMRVMQDANRQLNNALLHTGNLFTCTLEKGRLDKRDEWSQEFTQLIQKPLQRGRSGKKYNYLIRARNASICIHGIGAMLWPNGFRWCPRFVPLEDLLIPTDTLCDFSNLRFFAVNFYLSPGEFIEMTSGKDVQKGWNKTMVDAILEEQKTNFIETAPNYLRNQPEATQEVAKQNGGYLYSDAIPKIKLRYFYYQEIDKPNKWYRCVILREAIGKADVNKFIFEQKDDSFASNIDEILNVQYGDTSLVPPLKYHSVRGLGVPLYSPFETANRLQCEIVQHTFEQLKMYFRIQDPADRDRLKQVVLQQYGFIPEGLQIVPRDQRHQIDANLVEAVQNQMRQITNENSASFVQNTDSGTGKEMTAFETKARLNQVNQMVLGMFSQIYFQGAFCYQEVNRRFLIKDSEDREVKQFQEDCLKAGIPKELMTPDAWHVVPERVLGAGDRTLAQAQADWLQQHKNEYDPTAQRTIMRIVTSTMLDDPSKGRMLVPKNPDAATDGSRAAEDVFGTLMQGQECDVREGIDQIGYIEKMLKLMDGVIKRIQGTDNMGTPTDIFGLKAVATDIDKHIQILAGDKAEQQRVKQYSDVLGKLHNETKGFAQRLAEKQKSSQQDPEAQAKVETMRLHAETKHEIAVANAQQKLSQREAAFEQKMSHDLTKFEVEMKKMITDAQANIAALHAKTAADIQAKKASTSADIITKRATAKTKPDVSKA